MSIEQIVADCRVHAAIDEDRASLWLYLSRLHHNVRLIVVEVVLIDLYALPHHEEFAQSNPLFSDICNEELRQLSRVNGNEPTSLLAVTITNVKRSLNLRHVNLIAL